jgi:spore coat protein CotH
VLSEIMYHPVLETTAEDLHEFIEIHNRDKTPVTIAGWKLQGDGAGGIAFTFPAGTAIAPGQFLVVAKSKQRLLEVTKYALKPEQVLGDYAGELDNGGGLINLLNEATKLVDAVKYDDKFPWPIAADSLGAGERWFTAPGDPRVPFKNHQYMGVSLERVRMDLAGNDVANWAPSPLDGATPGRANAGSLTGPLPSIVTGLQAAGKGAAAISATSPVIITAQVSAAPPDGLAVEYFLDEMGRRDEMPVVVPMTRGSGENVFAAELPAQKASALVRYRIRGEKGKREILSPRPSDPRTWYAYFVSPELKVKSRVYHLFIEPDDWQKMWNNVKDLQRVVACKETPGWHQLYPAALVHEGQVYDVGVRYQGSKWSRNNGAPFKRDFPFPHPSAPAPMTALSIRVHMPRYDKFEKREKFNLNKLYQDLKGQTQNCNLFDTGVGGKIYPQVGIPATATRFVHVQINGGYFHYYNEYLSIDEELASAAYPDGPVGDLFKARGGEDEGPYGVCDFRPIGAACGYTADYRYAYSYRRRTNKWKGEDNGSEVKALIEGYAAARRGGVAAVKAYVDKTFDVPALLTYMAIRNFAIPKDDLADDYYVYRKPDGKWMLWPWDLDKEWGGRTDAASGGTDYANVSFNIGETGDRNNYEGGTNELKDGVIKAYRSEIYARMKELVKGPLSAENIGKAVDELYAGYDPEDAMAAPAGVQCTRDEVASRIKRFAEARIKGVAKLP